MAFYITSSYATLPFPSLFGPRQHSGWIWIFPPVWCPSFLVRFVLLAGVSEHDLNIPVLMLSLSIISIIFSLLGRPVLL